MPDGESIEPVRGEAARDPDARYVSGRAVLFGLGLLAAASVISRILGR
ncbi:hypothetical protein ACFVWX_13445 [Streptomyces sp. NPDC058220]